MVVLADGRAARAEEVVGATLVQDERDDTRAIALEGELDDVEHMVDGLEEIDVAGRRGAGIADAAGLFDEACLELTDAAEVAVELDPVAGAELCLERAKVVEAGVEHGGLEGLATCPLCLGLSRIEAGEEAVEDGARGDLLGDGRGLVGPGDVGLVDGRVAGVASVAPGARREHERGDDGREGALVVRRHLVDGDAVADVRAVGLAQAPRRQERAGVAGVVPRTVARLGAIGIDVVAASRLVAQAGEDRDHVANGLDRPEQRRHRVVRTRRGRRHACADDPVGHVYEDQARGVVHLGARGAAHGGHRLEIGQGDRSARAAEEDATREATARGAGLRLRGLLAHGLTSSMSLTSRKISFITSPSIKPRSVAPVASLTVAESTTWSTVQRSGRSRLRPMA